MLRFQPYDIMVKPSQFAWDSQQFTTIESLQNSRGFFTSNIISLLFLIVLLDIWYKVSRDCTMEILHQPLVYCCSTSTWSYAKILEDRKIRRLLDLFVTISKWPSFLLPSSHTQHHTTRICKHLTQWDSYISITHKTP
jgi:hypothetical protein